jgi:hypothetical protein
MDLNTMRLERSGREKKKSLPAFHTWTYNVRTHHEIGPWLLYTTSQRDKNEELCPPWITPPEGSVGRKGAVKRGTISTMGSGSAGGVTNKRYLSLYYYSSPQPNLTSYARHLKSDFL